MSLHGDGSIVQQIKCLFLPNVWKGFARAKKLKQILMTSWCQNCDCFHGDGKHTGVLKPGVNPVERVLRQKVCCCSIALFCARKSGNLANAKDSNGSDDNSRLDAVSDDGNDEMEAFECEAARLRAAVATLRSRTTAPATVQRPPTPATTKAVNAPAPPVQPTKSTPSPKVALPDTPSSVKAQSQEMGAPASPPTAKATPDVACPPVDEDPQTKRAQKEADKKKRIQELQRQQKLAARKALEQKVEERKRKEAEEIQRAEQMAAKRDAERQKSERIEQQREAERARKEAAAQAAAERREAEERARTRERELREAEAAATAAAQAAARKS
jgi:hypothetical protein